MTNHEQPDNRKARKKTNIAKLPPVPEAQRDNQESKNYTHKKT